MKSTQNSSSGTVHPNTSHRRLCFNIAVTVLPFGHFASSNECWIVSSPNTTYQPGGVSKVKPFWPLSFRPFPVSSFSNSSALPPPFFRKHVGRKTHAVYSKQLWSGRRTGWGKNDAERCQKEGERLSVGKERKKWVQNRLFSVLFRKRTIGAYAPPNAKLERAKYRSHVKIDPSLSPF